MTPSIVFLQGPTIDVEFEGDFIERVDYDLCKMILANDPTLCVDGSGKLLTKQTLTNFQNAIMNNLKKDGLLTAKHYQTARKLGRNCCSVIPYVHLCILRYTP